jgi:hypothetical protein
MAVEKINSYISESEAYQQWLKNFLAQDSGEEIKRLLKNFTHKDLKEARDWLKLHVLVTCFCADKYKEADFYKKTGDQGHRKREQEKERIKEIKPQIKATEKIIKLVGKDPYASRRFILACSDLYNPKDRRSGRIIFKDIKGRIDTIFPEVLENYKADLERELKYSNERLNQMLFTYGGLAFPEKNDGKTFKIRDIRRNSFYFHMTYIFRHYTAQKLNLGDSLCQMPDIGESRYDLTGNIYTELFPKEKNAPRALEKMIAHLVSSHVYIHPWHLSI